MIALAVGLFLQVQVGLDVRPDTVTVGEHFIATVRVRAPLGATIKFPDRPSLPENVDTSGSSLRKDTTGATYVESTIAYRLSAWRTGLQSLGLGSATVSLPTGDQTVSLSDAKVFVRSVLPADTTLRVPKDLRPPFTSKEINWLPWIIAAIAAALAGALWWFWRRFRGGRGVDTLSSFDWAQAEFQRINALNLLPQGKSEEYAILMGGVFRGYLSKEFSALHSSYTTREVEPRLHSLEDVVPGNRTLVTLERIDLLKYARSSLSKDNALALGNESQALVRRIHESVEAQRKVQASSGNGSATISGNNGSDQPNVKSGSNVTSSSDDERTR